MKHVEAKLIQDRSRLIEGELLPPASPDETLIHITRMALTQVFSGADGNDIVPHSHVVGLQNYVVTERTSRFATLGVDVTV